VGGDYYDIIKISETEFVVAIGDVSGKGTPASLLMANLQAAVRALVPIGLPLPELTSRINDMICENTGTERFITFFWCVLNTEAMTMSYVNAGHNPPFLIKQRDASIERLEKGGMVLGVLKGSRNYEEGMTTIERGDIIIFYTDGVSEAMNKIGEEFTEARLESLLAHSKDLSAQEIVSKVVTAVQEHSESVPQSDDITLVILKANF
jgi:sigma-B regulation protein RsbU (phosphoserine phosphatase)